MDLLTVVTHELGHVMGFEHDHAGSLTIMDDDLPAGTRYLASGPVSARPEDVLRPAEPSTRRAPAFDAGPMAFAAAAEPLARSADARIAWQSSLGEGWNLRLSPYEPVKPAKGVSGNFAEFASLKPQGDAAQPAYDSMGRQLLDKGKTKGR
jgi:hypothetical protein